MNNCSVESTLKSYLKKEKIIGENDKILVDSQKLFSALDVLNNFAKNEFGVVNNVLGVKYITENRVQYPVLDINSEIVFEIDSKKGIYDSEASNKFRNTPPSGDNFVEILNYKKFQIEDLESKIDSLKRKLSDPITKKEASRKISTYNAFKEQIELQIATLSDKSMDKLFHAVHQDIDKIIADLDNISSFSLDEIKERRDFIWEFVKGTTFDSQTPSTRFDGLPDNEEFAEIRSKLDIMKDKYNSSINKFEKAALEENTMFNQLKSNIENSGLTPAEIEMELDNLFLAKKDITFFDKYVLGMNNSMQWDTLYPQLMYNEHAKEKHKEFIKINKLIQNLKKAVGDTKNIEFVKDVDDKGNLTGYITDSYSHKWADFMFNIRKIGSQFRMEGNSVNKFNHYKRFITTAQANGEFIDPRKLSLFKDNYSTEPLLAKYFKFSDEEISSYEQTILDKIGQEKFNKLLESLTFQIENYLEQSNNSSRSERSLASINLFEFMNTLEDKNNTDKLIYIKDKNGNTVSVFYNDLNSLVLIPKEEVVSGYNTATNSVDIVDSGYYNENFKNLDSKQKEILATYREAAEYFNHTYSLNKFDKLSFPKVMQEFSEQAAKNLSEKKFGKISKDLAHEYKAFFYEIGRFSVEGSDVKANYRDDSKRQIDKKASLYRLQGMDASEAYYKAKQEILNIYSDDTLRDMEAILNLAAEQRARENALPKINTYMEKFKSIKSLKDDKERIRAIQKVQGWIDRRIYGITEADRGSESLTDKSWLSGKDSKKIFEILGNTPVLSKLVNEKTPKLLNQVEKELYTQLQKLKEDGFNGEHETTFTVGDIKYEYKRVVNQHGQAKERFFAKDIGGNTTITKDEFNEKFQEWINNEIDNLGLDLTTSGILQGLMKTTILKGLGVNFISGLFNRLEGLNSLLVMDKTGSYWSKDNAMYATGHMNLFNTVKILPNVITKQWEAKYNQVQKIKSFLELMNVIQDRKNVFESNSESSKYDLGNLKLYALSVDNPEAKNQGTIALAVAMDHMVTDNDGIQVPLYDREGNFNAFEMVNGELVLKEQFVDPENGINNIYDFMASEEIFQLKQKMTQAISKSQGNYDSDDVMYLTKNTWGKLASTFTKWRYEHIMQRFSPGQGWDLSTGNKRAKGRYSHLWQSTGSMVAAGGVAAGITFGFGIPVVVGMGGIGLTNLVVKKFFKDTYVGEIERQSNFLQEYSNFLLSTLIETLNYPLRLISANGKFSIKYDPYKKMVQNNTMTEDQANNIAACTRELAIMLMWIGILLAFKAMTWDDDDDKDSDRRMLHNFGDNQINRIVNSMLAYANPKAMLSDVTRFAVAEQIFKIQDVIAGLNGDSKSGEKLGRNLLDITPLPRVLYKDHLPWHDKAELDHIPGLQSTTYSVWSDHFINSFTPKEKYKKYRAEKTDEITRELEAQGLEGSALEDAVKKRVSKEVISKPREYSYDDVIDDVESEATATEVKQQRKASQSDRKSRKEELKEEGLSNKEISNIMKEEFRGR